VFVLVGAGCQVQPTLIQTDPAGAKILINNADVGASPLSHAFDFSETPNFVIVASKPGYFDNQITITKASKDVDDTHQVHISLMEDESLKATVTSEAANNWLRLQIDPAINYDTLWQKVVDAVTSRYPSLEMIDDKSGYLRSIFVMQKFKSPNGERQIRTRFVGNVASKEPLVYKLKIESEIHDGDQGDWHPYSRVLREDQQLIEEIQGRVGVK
jgi:hypothetical protein